MTNRGNWEADDPSAFVVHVPSNSAGMSGAVALDAVGAGVGDGVTGGVGDGLGTGEGAGVGPAVTAGMGVRVLSAAGVMDGPAADEQAMSSPATENAISIPVWLLARIGQLPGRLVGARARIGPSVIATGAGETLRFFPPLRERRTAPGRRCASYGERFAQ